MMYFVAANTTDLKIKILTGLLTQIRNRFTETSYKGVDLSRIPI